MDYPPDAFDALVAEVEQQGGALLPEEHLSLDVRYTVPPYARASIQRKATCGCRHQALLVSTYSPDPEIRQGGSGFVTACAVCDSVGAWPRYCDAVYDVDPELNPSFDDDEDDDEEDDLDYLEDA